MVNSKDRFEADLKRLARAQETLVEALKQPKNSFIRDAVVKRFEYTFEISWKTVKAACDYLGFDCKSPREAIRTAFKQGWIKETEGWFEMLDARNLTSHTYEEEIAEDVYNHAAKFPALIHPLIESLKTIK